MSQFLLTEKSAALTPNPATNKHIFLIDSATGQLASKNSAGEITLYTPQPVGAEQHSQYVTVGQPGKGDAVAFTSVKLAIDSIVDASESKPYSVILYPGVYTVEPTAVSDWICVLAVGGEGSVILVADSDVSPMFTLGSNCSINNVFFKGGNNTSCVHIANGDSVSYVEDCVMMSGKKLVEATGAGTQIFVEETKVEAVVEIGSIATSGAFIGMTNCFNRAIVGAKCDASEMAINNCYMGNLGAGTGLSSVNGGVVRAEALTIAGRAQALHVANAGRIDLIGGALYSNLVDLVQDDASSIVTGQAISMHTDKLSMVNPDNVKIQFQSAKVGDEAFKMYTELTVGHAGAGRESVLGEGDSYTNGRRVFDYNGSSFNEVPTQLNEIDTITHTMGTSAGNMLYVASTIHNGSDFVKIFRLKMTLISEAVAPDNSYLIEIWNGSAWQEIHYMVKDSTGKFLPHAEDLFKQPDPVQVRLGAILNTDWVKNDPMLLGTDYYWLRIRNVNGVTSQASIEQLKVGGSSTEINEDGFQEYYGNARPRVRLPFDWGSVEAANNSPSNADSYLADKMAVGRQKNSFQNSTVDRAGLNAFLPLEIDTSCPVTLKWAVQGSSSGDVRWNVRWAKSADGDSVYDNSGDAPTNAPLQKVTSFIHSIASADTQYTVEATLDVSDFIAERDGGFGDILWISIERDATDGSDTLNGNVNIIQLVPYYIKCCEGGHL
jgi:hypothetical protein